jgi:hypothetical protein
LEIGARAREEQCGFVWYALLLSMEFCILCCVVFQVNLLGNPRFLYTSEMWVYTIKSGEMMESYLVVSGEKWVDDQYIISKEVGVYY